MTISMDEALRPPTEAEVERVVAAFASAAKAAYGESLVGLYLFGSRARNDHRADSDVDVAVILADREFDFWREKMRLTDIAFDADFGTTVYIQAWPLTSSTWSNPHSHHNPAFVKSIKRDAVLLARL